MKIKKWKEVNHKEKGIILFTILSILLIIGVFFYQSFAIFKTNTNQDLIEGNVIDTKDIYFAFYYDGKIQKEMPGANYILDEENSYCGELGKKEGSFKPIYEEQKVIIDGLTKSHTKCILAFRNYNKVTIGEEVKNVSIPNSTLTISKPNDSLLIQCNNGVTIKENNNQITISNITKDTTCNYYNDSATVINNIDNSENYILYLKNNEQNETWTIEKGKNVTIDLNAHSELLVFHNYGTLNLISSSTQKGILNMGTSKIVDTYDPSYTKISNCELKNTGDNHIVQLRAVSALDIENSNLINDTPIGTPSAVISTSRSTVNITNSTLKSAYGIGGEGGQINIDNTNITGITTAAIRSNSGNADITIKNKSNLTGKQNGIISGDNLVMNVTLIGTAQEMPSISSIDGSALKLQYGTLNWQYGETYGKMENSLTAGILIKKREGTVLKTEPTNGNYHTYLQ